MNCDALCFQCHTNNEGSKQGFYREWKIRQLGQETYDKLEKRARSTVQYGAYEKVQIEKRLKEHGLDGLEEWLYTLWPMK